MSSIFQTPEWEEFKLKTGYQKSYRIDDILVLVKKLPLGTMLYSPMVAQNQISDLKNQKYQSKIKEIARQEGAIFYRLEFDLVDTPDNRKLITNDYIKAFEEMQPEHTLILDIDQPESEILSQMKPKGRYNIKVAQRNQVKVSRTESIDNFLQLYETMAKRQRISYRGKRYFETLIDILGQKDYIAVFEAGVPKNDETGDPKCLAAAIVSFYNGRATYLFGGSSNDKRNLMAPYQLHWEIIRESKKRGMKEYDFFGIAPEGQPNHPWAGVTRFKEQFGGHRKDILGSWDLVFNKIKYQAFKIGERIRRG